MFDKIIFHEIYYGQNCTIQFNRHTLFNNVISVDEYSFAYEFDEDEIETIAKLLDRFYGVIKDKLITGAEREQIKQYNALQIILRNIMGD